MVFFSCRGSLRHQGGGRMSSPLCSIFTCTFIFFSFMCFKCWMSYLFIHSRLTEDSSKVHLSYLEVLTQCFWLLILVYFTPWKLIVIILSSVLTVSDAAWYSVSYTRLVIVYRHIHVYTTTGKSVTKKMSQTMCLPNHGVRAGSEIRYIPVLYWTQHLILTRKSLLEFKCNPVGWVWCNFLSFIAHTH